MPCYLLGICTLEKSISSIVLEEDIEKMGLESMKFRIMELEKTNKDLIRRNAALERDMPVKTEVSSPSFGVRYPETSMEIELEEMKLKSHTLTEKGHTTRTYPYGHLTSTTAQEPLAESRVAKPEPTLGNPTGMPSHFNNSHVSKLDVCPQLPGTCVV